MNEKNYLYRIEKRIKESDPGTIFIPSDFLDIADTNSVNKSLSRLSGSGIIRRIIRGVYEYPRYSEFLSEYVAPSPSKIAEAQARNYSWTIVPSGNTALNQLGISTQVPATWEYVSDGPNKVYEYDNTKIQFRHTEKKDISKVSYKTALVIQAIRALGKNNITNDSILKIRNVLSSCDLDKMLSEGRYTTAWVYAVIKKICMGGEEYERNSIKNC